MIWVWIWDSHLINLICKEIEWGISNQYKEWNCFITFAKGTVSAHSIHIWEFRMNSQLPRQQTRWDLIYVTLILFLGTSWGLCSLSSLLLRKRSSSAESAHANTEARVNAHCLDSSSKSMEDKAKRRNFSQSEWKWDLDYFCRFGVGSKIFCPGNAKKRENFDWEFFCSKRKEEELDLE